MKWDRWILKIDGFLKDGLLEIDVYPLNIDRCIPFIEWWGGEEEKKDGKGRIEEYSIIYNNSNSIIIV